MLKNTLITLGVVLVSIFIVAFGMTTYRYYQAIHSDDPIDPYLLVEEGQATITRGDIAIDMVTPDSYDIREGDIIITRADSLAVIHWPDHSTTRLGSDSRLTIEKMRVAQDYSSIELVASLESGKTWTNIVRTLYPDSHIEFRLPKSGTVAGVRGTVFEINLDADYIHSVDHSVTLKNSFGKFVTLLPGESVMATDIFKRITKGIDTTWNKINLSKDAIYMDMRSLELRKSYDQLIGKSYSSYIGKTWDSLVTWILSWFSSFKDISILRTISLGGTLDIARFPQDTILKWYQSFQGKNFLTERDQMRGVIIYFQKSFKNGDQLIDTLTKSALWDIDAMTTTNLENAKKLLDNYAKKTGTNLENITTRFQKIDVNRINTESYNMYQKLFN